MSDEESQAAERRRLDDLAAKMFPREWGRANARSTGRSKARRSLRARVAHSIRIKELREQGASCGNCRDFRPRPGPGNKGQMICDAGSDFHGDHVTTADKLCTGWAAKP